jgi:chemotaxis response regulator CheB
MSTRHRSHALDPPRIGLRRRLGAETALPRPDGNDTIRDIIVIGAPIGGGAAIAHVIGSFPPQLDAAVFVVLHSTPSNPILLADILNAPGRLRAATALHGEPIARRRIYLAALGQHLMLGEGVVRLSENFQRSKYCPSIDVLFSSAAEAYKTRVIGVLLLHPREDGLLGLSAIRRAGGRTVTHCNELMPTPRTDPNTGEPLSDKHVHLETIASHVADWVEETKSQRSSYETQLR